MLRSTMVKAHVGVLLCAVLACYAAAGAEMSNAEKDLEKRLAKRLEWFQDMKFGFFVHWGIYSQWGCIESWPLIEEDKWARPDDLPPWVERKKDMETFKRDYRALNRTFNPRKFEPRTWAEAAKYAGMKYFCFTTKHHDGFCMFDTKQTDYRITYPDCPYSRTAQPDVAKVLFDTFRDEGFAISAYFSKSDWHHPAYWSPDAPAKTRNPNYDTLKNPEQWRQFVDFVHAQIEELMTGYGKVDILWLDGGQVRPPQQDIQMDRVAAMARSHQKNLLIVDRTVGGKHENYRTPEQEVPDKPQQFVWESCITMGEQWSYKPNDKYKSSRQLIHLLVDVVAKGGNLILNVGPTSDGELPPGALERLRDIGDWMKTNGEAIYKTRVLPPYKSGRVCFTRRGGTGYAIYLCEDGQETPPRKVAINGVVPKRGSKVRLLGAKEQLRWEREGQGISVDVPQSVIESPPCKHAFVFKMALDEGERD
ncbi:MAG: alpha-L-fucosidase [Planctomycetota bacterium]|nr:alpha-L-fucosidase [Planctomycetota bacterium]